MRNLTRLLFSVYQRKKRMLPLPVVRGTHAHTDWTICFFPRAPFFVRERANGLFSFVNKAKRFALHTGANLRGARALLKRSEQLMAVLLDNDEAEHVKNQHDELT